MCVNRRVTRAAAWVGVTVLTLLAGAYAIYVNTGGLGHAATMSRWVDEVRPAVPAPVAASTPPSPTPSAAPETLPVPLLRPGVVRISTPGFWSWALLDTRTGTLAGAANLAATSTTASMIKSWIAADYLRRLAERGTAPTAERLAEISTMIRDSNNQVAIDLFAVLGQDASIRRLVALCRLTETKPYGSSWSRVTVSARDTARLAACLGDGRAAGPQWTPWLLNEMRLVHGTGDFGIRKALPPEVARRTPIKNGWLLHDDDQTFHIACLAIGDGWTLGVLARYPGYLGMEHGKKICQDVAAQLLVRP